MKAGFVQFDPRFGDPEYNRHAAFSLMEKSTSQLLVLPELFTTGYLFVSKKEVEEMAEEIPQGITTRRLSEFARDKNCHVVAGLAERAGDKYFNSSVIVGPGGYIGTYRKIHLFNEEKLFFSPGDLPFEVYDIGEARVGMLICFDWFFPESARALALKGADIIAHCANLVLPHCPPAMITRCLENRIFAITADRIGCDDRGKKKLEFIGLSQIVDPSGRVLVSAPEDKPMLGEFEIDPEAARNKTLLEYNNLFGDRRPEFYGMICESNQDKEFENVCKK